MPATLNGRLVVAISSRALFNLDESHAVFFSTTDTTSAGSPSPASSWHARMARSGRLALGLSSKSRAWLKPTQFISQ